MATLVRKNEEKIDDYPCNAIARDLDPMSKENTEWFVREMVSNMVNLIATDESAAYANLKPTRKLRHAAVNHSAHKYVVRAAHTNTIEGSWSIFKRGVVSAPSTRSAASTCRCTSRSFSSAKQSVQRRHFPSGY